MVLPCILEGLFFYDYMSMFQFSLISLMIIFALIVKGIYVNTEFFLALVCLFFTINSVLVITSPEDNDEIKHTDYYFYEANSKLVVPFLSLLWIIYFLMLYLYLFWNEKSKYLYFKKSFNKIKEFSRLNSILQVLLPSFVRERIRQGQRCISDE